MSQRLIFMLRDWDSLKETSGIEELIPSLRKVFYFGNDRMQL